MKDLSASVGAREGRDPRLGGVVAAGLGAALLFTASLLLRPAPFGMVSPFPLLVLRLRTGAGAAWGGAVLAASLLGAVFSPGHALAFLLLLVVPVLLIGEAMARGRGMLRGCGWAFALLVLELGTMLFFAHETMSALALKPIDYVGSAEFTQDWQAAGMPSDQIQAWTEWAATFRGVMAVVYPAAYIIGGALVVLANAALLRGYLARRDPGWLDGGEFENVRWPLGLAVLFVLSGAMVLSPPLRPAAYNLLLIEAFFFALQGLAVVAYFAHRLAAPALLRGAVLLLVLINPWAPQILAVLGLFDLWFNFRRFADPPAEEE
ncbi:MAG TPA: DUF2232 domain-containing protein [Vicinamibacteria bacterium]